MTDDHDRAYDDLSKWPIEALGNFDAGAMEIRRRGVEAALSFFAELYPDDERAELIQMLDIAVEEAAEAAGIVLDRATE